MEPVKRVVAQTNVSVSTLKDLPDYLLFPIFALLTPVQVCKMRLVCKKWKQVAEDRLIWKQLFRQNFPLTHTTLSSDIDYLGLYCSILRKMRISTQIRFNNYHVEEERRIIHPRYKWPWVFGVNGRSLILWNLETEKTHLMQLQTFFKEERPFLQPLAIKKGFIYVKTSHPIGQAGCTVHEITILKGLINRSFSPPNTGRLLHFKKMALYYIVQNVVHVWHLHLQEDIPLIQKNSRIREMSIQGDIIAIIREDNGIDLHQRVTGQLLSIMAPGRPFISLGKTLNRGQLVFTLNPNEHLIEAREIHSLRLVTSYPYMVVARGFNQSQLSEVVLDENFLVVKIVHTQNQPIQGHPEKQTTLEFFDIETGSSITVIKLEKEPFGLFFKNGKIFYQVHENVSGKEKIKTEWVDFNDEKDLKRKGCVIS